MNLQENIQRIKEMMGLSSDGIIEKNIKDQSLIKILYDIEKKTGKKFTQKHFDDEKSISGGEKTMSKGLNPDALKSFEKLQKACRGLTHDEDSYRTYERQAELFIEYVEKYGSIEGAMKLRAIPGFSQHHTGKAFDIEQKGKIRKCAGKNAPQFGFIFPYQTDGIRVKEPWHIYYNI